MKRIGKDAMATLLALMMTLTALSGCSGTDDELDKNDPNELEDWNVFLVQSEAELPECDSSTNGRLYYLSSDSSFKACSGGSWSNIDLTGPAGADGQDGSDGEQGPQGPAGADGQDGSDGEQGPQGPAGSDGMDGEDGTSFTIVGTVEETSDLGEIYIGNVGDAFYVNSTSHIHVWDGNYWIDLGNISGPLGPQGETGPPGPEGPIGPSGLDGVNGTEGPSGTDGDDGLSTLVVTSALSVGSSGCPMGGNMVRIGMDDDGDGVLTTMEVDQTMYVCNGVNGIDGNDGADGADGVMPTVMEMDVTVSSMDFYIDDIQQADVTLYRGFTYTFIQSDTSNSYHPIRLSATNDGTHGGGSAYTDGVTYTGTQGSSGILTFTVPLDAPATLYYYCQNHANMGGTITIQSLGSVS